MSTMEAAKRPTPTEFMMAEKARAEHLLQISEDLGAIGLIETARVSFDKGLENESPNDGRFETQKGQIWAGIYFLDTSRIVERGLAGSEDSSA
jgi:hypothetical protein